MSVEPHRGEGRSLPDLVVHALRETSELLRTELRMVRTELSDKVAQIEAGAGSLAAGAICLLVALFVLSQALVVAVGELIGDAWAALLVGLVIAAIGVALLLKGRKDLQPDRLMPERTSRQLGKDTELVKEQGR
ncbi:MAG: phage holin family protein [Fulvimarina manganoxydans]|uniref:phage holin family protein n=1 Tax=Fulvimarina manganoxydans TaxID=937218 RepID=UPI0023520093|nr:phage holin family protein [Fulvimarina manganoxydans]MCK5930945.1 phage holin family protein [Fulvimarina manganoxydans]